MMNGSVAVTSGAEEVGGAIGWLRDVFVGSSSLSSDELVAIGSIVRSIVSDCELRYEKKVLTKTGSECYGHVSTSLVCEQCRIGVNSYGPREDGECGGAQLMMGEK